MPVRRRVDRRREELPEDAWAWLYGEDHTTWSFFQDSDELAAEWRTRGGEIVAEHVRTKPGTRPCRWWDYDAPRLVEAGFWNGKLAEPRRQVGGSGKRHHGVVPHSHYGIPRIMADVDPEDPPVFESEATYLDRHGLLTAAERRRLRVADYEPVVIDAR